jgi:hypothetical protein
MKTHNKIEDFRTEYGKKAFLNAKSQNYAINDLEGIYLIERWIHYGKLAPMTYMALPSLIEAIKSGKLKEEYEVILKELNPEGYEEYKRTGKIDSYSEFK